MSFFLGHGAKGIDGRLPPLKILATSLGPMAAILRTVKSRYLRRRLDDFDAIRRGGGVTHSASLNFNVYLLSQRMNSRIL